MKKKISFPSFIMQNEQHLSKYTHLFEWMNAIKKEHHYTNNSFTIDNNTLPNNIPMDTGAMCDGFSVPRILFCKYHSYFNRLPFDVSSLNGLLLINSFFWSPIGTSTHSHIHIRILWLLRFTSLYKSLEVEDISCLSWNSMKNWTYSTTRFRQFVRMYRKSKMATHIHTQAQHKRTHNVCIVSECVIKIKKTKKQQRRK